MSPILCAVYYPARGTPLGDRYVLSSKDLEFIRANLRGVAVTYNHTAVGSVVQNLVAQRLLPTPSRVKRELSLETEGSRRPVGEIIDAWSAPDGAEWCSFTLDAGENSSVMYLIKEGFLRGLSLTHVAGHVAVPIEAALCKTPARPGCSIRHIAPSAFEATRYKGLVEKGLIPSTMTTPTPVDSALEIIASLDEDKRKIVEDAFLKNHRLVQASKKEAVEAASKAESLQAKLDEQNKIYDADIGVMKAEIEAFANTIDAVLGNRPELNGKLTACKNLSDTLSGLPLGTLRAVDNLVVCASKAMQVMQENASASSAEEPRKRARMAEPVVEKAPERVMAEPTEPMNLRQALAASFEM